MKMLFFFVSPRWEDDSQHLCPAVSDCVSAGHCGADPLYLQRCTAHWEVHALHHGLCHCVHHYHCHCHQHPPPLPKHSYNARLGPQGELTHVILIVGLKEINQSFFYTWWFFQNNPLSFFLCVILPSSGSRQNILVFLFIPTVLVWYTLWHTSYLLSFHDRFLLKPFPTSCSSLQWNGRARKSRLKVSMVPTLTSLTSLATRPLLFPISHPSPRILMSAVPLKESNTLQKPWKQMKSPTM